MIFSVHGPFPIPRQKNRLLDASSTAKNEFWKAVNKTEPALSEACGCYVYCVRARRGTLPWYVGRTAKATFRSEALGAYQVNHYNNTIQGKNGVQPQLFFLAKETPAGRFAKPSVNSHDDIEFLETFLFGIALSRNPNLRNSKHTRFLRNLIVAGIINSPARRPSPSERLLKSALSL